MPRLVKEVVSHDVIECCDQIANGARDGHVVGAVFGILYRRRSYAVAVSGVAQHDPTWARGVLGAIEDELRDLIHEQSRSR